MEDLAPAFNSAWTAPSPIACGLRTDHPIVGLPLVDDGELDLADRHAIEAIGRVQGNDLGAWGREDRIYLDQPEEEPSLPVGWCAFTTSGIDPRFSWVVRRHEDETVSVLLYCGTSAGASAFSSFDGSPELYLMNRGGYHLDREKTWRRPRHTAYSGRVRFVDHGDRPAWEPEWTVPVPAARTVSAMEYLSLNSVTPEEDVNWIPWSLGGTGRFSSSLSISSGGLVLDVPDTEPWNNEFSLWLVERDKRAAAGEDLCSLADCVVGFTAPELNPAELIDSTRMAAMAGRTINNFSANRARGGIGIPQPYVHLGGNPVWTYAVGSAWAAGSRRGEG
ncbi:hypothetical protein P0W64_19325 [Tsukamurella sp. 8F]|uniref:hypothetical protein n=1 Tax=unclassified Tsukamurella TaxID=2633480 RepID=UPI0023BA11F0|nr:MULTISPECIES: hypothetical protein [unclassified Tsukamurella]MDF0531692.1 hypothetical protein [Tsukamurella sp. 8J]MDF0588938.1 hypothetical protein [Tsukamurella sp. 8F]